MMTTYDVKNIELNCNNFINNHHHLYDVKYVDKKQRFPYNYDVQESVCPIYVQLKPHQIRFKQPCVSENKNEPVVVKDGYSNPIVPVVINVGIFAGFAFAIFRG